MRKSDGGGAVDGPGPSSLAVPGVTGFLGSVCVILGAAQQGSPFTVHGAGAWFFAGATTTPGGATPRFLGIMLVYVGIALLLGSWYEVVRTVRRRVGTPVMSLVAVMAAWSLPIVVGAPLFSGDVYSYAAQGQMVATGLNPYRHGPNALGGGAFLRLVDPLWRSSPAPYGPGWERLSGWIVQWSDHDVVTSVVAFRLVAVVGVVLLVWAVPALARSVGRDPAAALALAVLNPLVLLDLLGGAHNDALMLGLLVAGCALARRRHVLAGLVLCCLAAEVKIPALVGVVFIGWWWAGADADRRQPVAPVGLAVGVATAVMVTIGAVAGLGWRWIGALTHPGVVVSWLDPVTALGLLMAHVASWSGHTGHQAAFVDGSRIVGLAVAVVISVRLVLRSDRRGPVAAIGFSLLAFVVLGPVVWPWYETWGFVFLAVEAEGWIVPFIVVLSAVACYADVPRPGLLIDANPVLVVVSWICLAGLVGWYVRTRVAPVVAGRPRGTAEPVGVR